MTPARQARALQLAAEGVCELHAAAILRVSRSTLRDWARGKVRFADGRSRVRDTRMTPAVATRARAMAAEGLCKAEAARRLDVPYQTLRGWAERNKVTFTPGSNMPFGGIEALRARLEVARRTPRAARPRPLSAEERKAYDKIRRNAPAAELPRDAIMRAIGRADLVSP